MNYRILTINYLQSNKLFLLALFSIHAFYFLVALNYQDIYTLDSDEYTQTAVNLVKHGEIYNYFWQQEHRPEYYSLRPPLYGLFILVLKLIYDSDLFVILIQNIMNIFSLIFFIELFRSKGISEVLKVCSILALVFFPTQMIMANSIMADQILQFFLILALACLMKYLDSRKAYFLVLYNLMLVLAVYTKPVLMYFWIPNLLFCLYLYVENRQKLILISSLLLPLSIYVWCARNETQTGLFHFSSIKTQNILDLNAGSVLTLRHGEDQATEIKDSILAKAETMKVYKDRVAYINSESMQIIQGNLGIYLYAHAKGMLNFMLAAGRTDMVDFFPDKPKEEISLIREFEKDEFSGLLYYFSQVNLFLIVFMFSIVLWNVLMLVSFLTFSFNSDFSPTIRLFVFVLIAYICFVCGPGGYARLKMCIMPFMLLNLPYLWREISSKFHVQSCVFER